MLKVLRFTTTVAAVSMSLAIGAGAAHAQAPQPAQGDSLYRAARGAITAGDYRKAATMFSQFVDKYPSSKTLADGLYWRAYSLYQLAGSDRSKSEYADALSALDRYGRVAGPSAPLTGDVADLRIRIRSAQAKLGDADAAGDVAQSAKGLAQPGGCSGSAADEETRMAALDGLLNMNSADAVPILKDVLKRRDACRVDLRQKAVWLISQKQAPDIVATLVDVARNDPSTDVRTNAVFWLSQTNSDQVVPVLDSILFSPGNDDIRHKAVFSLGQQIKDPRAAEALRRAIEDDRLPADIRGDAIYWLGNTQSDANLPYFKTLFGKTKDQDMRSKILFAVSSTPTPAAAAWLLETARDKSVDLDTRKTALYWLGQRKSFNLGQLADIYTQSRGDEDMQRQVLFVYSQRSEPEAVDRLMDIAKNDPNVEMKKQALFWLGQKHDPRVTKFILDMINKP
ncbi:MAG TPA: HEAT repeat domain-containing protein [Gemmatimonadaceae bacterium]|jgi:HEAT repeat protein